jgi:glycosyltransferase involved in cell wall biosynthesis
VKRVALYYPWIYLRGGAERVILEIARRSRHRYTIFTNHLNREQTYPELAALPDLVELPRLPVQRSFPSVLRAALTIARQKLDLAAFDALLVSSEGLGDFITFRNHEKPVVCFCHTPARPVYDPVYRRAWLEAHPRGRLPLAVLSVGYAWLTRLAWRHYRRVFVNSREVASRVLGGSLCAAQRLEVLHPGVDADRIHPSGAYEPYFLCAGRIKWTKNVGLAIDAFRAFRRTHPAAGGWRLLVAGALDGGSGAYLRELERLAAGEPGIEFQPNPTDEELAARYDRCYALVHPSLNEDWGLVPLEAMAHGKAVLAVNAGGPKESVLDGQTGFLLDPRPEAFADRMTWLAEHPDAARGMGARGAARVRTYSWDAFVGRLDDYIARDC